jgi:hypothetical protein
VRHLGRPGWYVRVRVRPAGWCGGIFVVLSGPTTLYCLDMADLRRTERKRSQTQSTAATETSFRNRDKLAERRRREAAGGNAYEPLVGFVQLGGAGEGRVWVGAPGEDGAEDSPALDGFAPSRASRQQFLDLVQRYRDANPVRVGASGWWGPRFAATARWSSWTGKPPAPAAAAPPSTAASVPASPSALTRCQPCSQAASSDSTPSAISCSTQAGGARQLKRDHHRRRSHSPQR